MIKVAICINNPALSKEISNRLRQCCFPNGIQVSITYHNENSLLREMSSGKYDLIFLHVNIPRQQALQIVEKSNVNVIFVCTCLTVSFYSDLGAFDNVIFLKEPSIKDNICVLVNETLRLKSIREREVLLIKNQHGIFKVRLCDILFLENHDKSIHIHTQTEAITSFSTMKEYECKLVNHGFYRCHTSYIVNTNYIASIQANVLSLINNQTIPISRYRKKGLLETYSFHGVM
ncbi:LytTR family transcriptional regulator DNA-binding domain-containing protein [Paenibacillus albidus]|nr:LytTR family transcriptional regulator DNA-binding domain-containing protein [Paenibacillus albidus]